VARARNPQRLCLPMEEPDCSGAYITRAGVSGFRAVGTQATRQGSSSSGHLSRYCAAQTQQATRQWVQRAAHGHCAST